MIDLLKTKIPGLSDLRDVPLAGDLIEELGLDQVNEGVDGVTILDLAKRFGVLSDDTQTFFEWLIRLDNVVRQVDAIPGSDPNGVWIRLGDLDLSGVNIRSVPLSSLDLKDQGNVDQVSAIISQLDNLPFGTFAKSFINDYLLDVQALGRPVFEMPLLRKPQSAFKLLLGQDVDLFTFGPPLIQGTIPAKLPFRIGPINVSLGGTIDYRFNFYFGFDTYGIRQYIRSGFTDVPVVVNGLYVLDQKNADGFDQAEVQLKTTIGVGGGVDIFIASGSITGSIHGEVNGFLNDTDHDGRIHLNELELFDPLCIFNLQGEISAGLFGRLRLGHSPFKKDIDFPFTEDVLISFDHTCPPPPPFILADVDAGDLLLHMGPNAYLRSPGESDVAEDFTVAHVSTEPDGTETVEVSAFQRSATYSGVRRIIGGAGNFDDVIRIESGVVSPTELHGGVGNDRLEGGDDNDTLSGEAGTDTLLGGADDDTLSGGDGDDSLNGEAGNDIFSGDIGTDTLFVDIGDDRLMDGASDDALDGEAGNDYVDGGDGNNIRRAAMATTRSTAATART